MLIACSTSSKARLRSTGVPRSRYRAARLTYASAWAGSIEIAVDRSLKANDGSSSAPRNRYAFERFTYVGTYHYVDTLEQAHSIFVEDLAGTLQVIAKDTKIQVEFNPEVVSRYRLLGYENRRVADQDFRDNTVDAGEVGAGHSVTTLYELKLQDGVRGNLGTVFVRYEDPNDSVIVEHERSLSKSELARRFEDTAPRFQLSTVVAEYAEILRGSYWAQEGNLGDVAWHASRVQGLLNNDPDVVELADLVYFADALRSGG